jgi:choice-of-anchor B domain-containing protein
MHRLFLFIAAIFLGLPQALLSQGSTNVTLLAQLDQYSSYASCWGYTAPDGREYALIGAFNGTSVVDITDGAGSYEVDFISGTSSSWRELKTYRHYAYVVNESGGGMQIIDLSDLPNSATLAATYTGFTTAHTVYIDTATAMLYAEGTTGVPVRAISLANPLSPVQLSTFGVECHDMYIHNNRAYVAEGFQGTVGVYDVTNPAAPVLLKRIGIPASGYVHNAWTTDDDRYLMTTEETSGKTVKMWDIQDLDNAFITDTYLSLPSNLAHNVHIKGNLAFIAHYGDGLRIVDISDPSNIFEIGYYDTHSGTTGFVGAWGTYPYYASNKVIISDISNGLFVFQFDDGTGGSGIPCDSIDVFQARCVSGGSIQARIVLFNSTEYEGQEVVFAIDEVEYTGVVGTNGTHSRASVVLSGQSSGNHTVALVSPSCVSFPAMTVACPAGAAGTDVTWDDSEWLTDADDNKAKSIPPTATRLIRNYPNPFNPATTISYEIGGDTWVSLKICNTLGEEIATLVNEYQTPGQKSVVWNGTANGKPVSSGIYVYRLTAGNLVQSEKMILTK